MFFLVSVIVGLSTKPRIARKAVAPIHYTRHDYSHYIIWNKFDNLQERSELSSNPSRFSKSYSMECYKLIKSYLKV